MPYFQYTAIIRTQDSFPGVMETVISLRSQTIPPQKIIIVDSGSSQDQINKLHKISDEFIDVSNRDFNYSYSINVAIPSLKTSHVLIISSHTKILDNTLMQDLLWLARFRYCAAVYCYGDESNPDFKITAIDRDNFNGTNGLFNRFSLIDVAELNQRYFREDVFSCEDQEWAAWIFSKGDKYINRVETNRCSSNNTKNNLNKWMNEQVALAYFVDKNRMSSIKILRWIISAIKSFLWCDFKWGFAKLQVSYRLVKARICPPRYKSKYF